MARMRYGSWLELLDNGVKVVVSGWWNNNEKRLDAGGG